MFGLDIIVTIQNNYKGLKMKTSNIFNGIANALNLSPKSLEIIADYVDINKKIYHNFNLALEMVKIASQFEIPPRAKHDDKNDFVRGYHLFLPQTILGAMDPLSCALFSDEPQSKFEEIKQEIAIRQSTSLFFNRVNALLRFIRENNLEFQIEFNSHYDLSLFEYTDRFLDDFMLEHFKFSKIASSLDDKDIVSANLGGLKFIFHKDEFLEEFNMMKFNPANSGKASEFLIHKYLGDFLSLLPDLEKEEDIEKLLKLKNKENIDNTIRGMQALLVELGVTDMYGEFEVGGYTSREIIELISGIHFLQNPNNKLFDSVTISHLIRNNQRGTFITANGFEFSVSEEYKSDNPLYRFAEKLTIRKLD